MLINNLRYAETNEDKCSLYGNPLKVTMPFTISTEEADACKPLKMTESELKSTFYYLKNLYQYGMTSKGYLLHKYTVMKHAIVTLRVWGATQKELLKMLSMMDNEPAQKFLQLVLNNEFFRHKHVVHQIPHQELIDTLLVSSAIYRKAKIRRGKDGILYHIPNGQNNRSKVDSSFIKNVVAAMNSMGNNLDEESIRRCLWNIAYDPCMNFRK